jgi:hypothetical protein
VIVPRHFDTIHVDPQGKITSVVPGSH